MTTKRARYAWYLMRESGKYSEYEMLKIVNGRTGEELNQIIDCLKEGKELPTDIASRKQLDYLNYLLIQLGYDTWIINKSTGDVEMFIEELEDELERQQIMRDVLGHGQQ